MAGRGRQTFEKRQREKQRQERAAAKRARREERKQAKEEEDPDEVVDTDDLLERFRILNEKHEAGEIDDESFEEEKEVLFEALGMQ
ncbi:MAG: hypothetical protein R3A49_02460 [Acidimicrobiia bacterium]